MTLLGAVLALGSAFFESLLDVFRKKTASAFDALTAAFTLHALTFVFALPFTLLVSFGKIPVPHGMQLLVHDVPASLDFWMPLAGSVALNSIAAYLVMDTLSKADLGMVLPLTTLSPVFLLLTAPIIVHEFPTWIGLIGILVTTAGTWCLARKKGQEGIWKPFQLLWSQESNRKMIFVALLYAISAPFDKRASMSGGPLWYLTFIDLGLALTYVPFMFRGRRWTKLFEDGGIKLLPLGISNLFRAWCQFTAFCLLLVPYAIGLKRLSVIFGILWGRWLFKERDTAQRLSAATIMIVGSVMILVAAVR
jgi:drug/metabolite transporter (DMT)-like permease